MDLSPPAFNKATDENSSSDASLSTCRRCQELNLKHMNPENNRYTVLGRKLASFSPSCRLCSIFRRICGSHLNYFDYCLLCCFYTSGLFPRAVPSTQSRSYRIEYVDGDSAPGIGRKGCGSGWLTPIRKGTGDGNPFYARILDDQVDFNLVRQWISFCSMYHKDCGEPIRKGFRFPIRAIDCVCHKVVWLPDGAPYLTLSYTWGPSARRQFFPGILPEALPSLIEDSMTTTVALGYRYLWIDYYCIDQRNREEVNNQISQMDTVYAVSEACIIAATCANPTELLPGVRKGSRPSSQLVEIEGETYTMNFNIRGQCAGTWQTRGWTYQEAVLSRRRVVFLSNEILFQCRCTSFIESINSINSPFINTPTQSCYLGELQLFVNVVPRSPPLLAFLSHFSAYSPRKMSFTEDILKGIHGIVQALRDFYPSSVLVSGIPIVPGTNLKATRAEQFVAGLAWISINSFPRRRGFPSWSWVGWEGLQFHPDLECGDITNDCLRIDLESRQDPLTTITIEDFNDYSTKSLSMSLVIQYIRITASVVTVRIKYSKRAEHAQMTVDGLNTATQLDSSDKIQCFCTLNEVEETLGSYEKPRDVTGIVLDGGS